MEKKIKERLYDIATNIGMRLFSEYWGKASLKANDRWIEYPWVLENLPKIEPMRILDVGCAGSIFPLILEALNHDVWGMDIQPYSLGHMFNFDQWDVTKAKPWLSHSFDVITAISTIEHIKDASKAISNIHSMLKQKGLFLMTVPYGRQARQTKFHLIHNRKTLIPLLKNFNFDVEVVDSPETKHGKIALIKAYK